MSNLNTISQTKRKSLKQIVHLKCRWFESNDRIYINWFFRWIQLMCAQYVTDINQTINLHYLKMSYDDLISIDNVDRDNIRIVFRLKNIIYDFFLSKILRFRILKTILKTISNFCQNMKFFVFLKQIEAFLTKMENSIKLMIISKIFTIWIRCFFFTNVRSIINDKKNSFDVDLFDINLFEKKQNDKIDQKHIDQNDEID